MLFILSLRGHQPMSEFDPNEYTCQIEDIFKDISISTLSYRAKIMLIRSYAEIIIRKLLNYSDEDFVTLGNSIVKKDLDDNGFTESWFRDSIEIIRKNGNDCCHTQKPIEITYEKWQDTEQALFNLFAYLFYRFFKQYGFDDNHPRILSTFSLLPPFLRHIVLEKLYDDDSKNIIVIDKFVLSKLKAFGYECAKKWITDKETELKSIEVSLLFNKTNAFDVESQKINSLLSNKPPYTNFKDAKKFYSIHRFTNPNDQCENDFLSLMDFVYLGW